MTAQAVSELLRRATSRERVQPPDGKSTSSFERVVIDGDDYFLKRLSYEGDWIMRVTGDHYHRPYLVWKNGVMDEVPASIDHAVVAMEVEGEGDGAELSMLMRDVGAHLVPEGSSVVPASQHAAFIDHLAEMCARFWGWRDTIGNLTTMEERIRFFWTQSVDREMSAEDPPGTIIAAHEGWQVLPDRSSSLADVAFALHEDPGILSGELAGLPTTFLHGDWKMGNLGSHPDGRTILLDWAYPGSGPACWDLWWYVCLNRDRLPEPKEDVLERFRTALERHGVGTSAWFERQLDLCVIAIMACFGWEKALNDDAELYWWERRVAEAVRRTGLSLA
ncbi:MAG TPA: phosphotransferase [Acidimicrobiales bacterium]|nr:phosphotransferase [Acidimicrobiales bacterium]